VEASGKRLRLPASTVCNQDRLFRYLITTNPAQSGCLERREFLTTAGALPGRPRSGGTLKGWKMPRANGADERDVPAEGARGRDNRIERRLFVLSSSLEASSTSVVSPTCNRGQHAAMPPAIPAVDTKLWCLGQSGFSDCTPPRFPLSLFVPARLVFSRGDKDESLEVTNLCFGGRRRIGPQAME